MQRSTKKFLAQNEKQYVRTLSEFTESALQFRNALDENRERINEILYGLVQSLSDQNGALTRIYNLTESFTDVSLRLREEAGNLPLETVNQVEMASSFDLHSVINFDPGGKNYSSFLFWILYDSPFRENVCA